MRSRRGRLRAVEISVLPWTCSCALPAGERFCPGERSRLEKRWQGIGCSSRLCQIKHPTLIGDFNFFFFSEWMLKGGKSFSHSDIRRIFLTAKIHSQARVLPLSRTTFKLNAAPSAVMEAGHVLCWRLYPSASSHFYRKKVDASAQN